MRTLGLGLGLFPPYGADPVEIIDSPDDIAGLVLWLRADQGLTLAMSPVVPTGFMPPTVTVSGTPVSGSTSIEIDITAPGTLGVAVFSWKLNTVVQQTLQVTSASFALGTTGITASFSAGTYAADNVYTTFVVVSAWADKSGTGDANKNTAQATSAKMPTLNSIDAGYSGQPTISFVAANSTNLVSGTWASPLLQPSTWVVVGESTGVSYFFDGLDTTHRQALFNNAGPTLETFAGSTLNGGGTNLSAKHVLGGTFNGGSSSIYEDSSQTPLITGAAGAQQLNGVSVGANNADAGPLQGKVAEMLAYNTILTATQLKGLFAYLGSRYGIAVS